MAQIVKMPDGVNVSFPDDMPREEIRALIEEKFPDAAKKLSTSSSVAGGAAPVSDAAEKPAPIFPMGGKGAMASQAMVRDTGTKPQIPEAELMSQGVSGVNEGIANLLSLPSNLGNAALSVGPAIANTIMPPEKSVSDLITGEEPAPRFAYPNYLPDPGKPARELMTLSGAIRPATDDLAGKVARRVGQEVGVSLPLGAARPVETIIAAVGSGLGASAAQAIDPDNPWLELAGQLAGGSLTGLLGATAKRLALKSPKPKGKPLTADDLQVLKNEAYKTVDDLGVKYSPQGYGKLMTQMEAAVKGKNISPTRHPKAYSLLEELKARAGNQNKGGLTLTEMDQLRQEIRRDLLQSSDASERYFGDLMMDEVDDFISKAGAGDVLAGDAKAGDAAIRAARELNTRFRKTELIEDALYAADMRTAAANGDINGAIKRAFNSILLNKKKAAAYSADEIADMEAIVNSGEGSKLLRNIGNLSADTGFKALLHGALAAHLGPLYAAVPIIGTGAKALAGGKTASAAATLRAKVAAGSGSTAANTLRAPLQIDPAASSATLAGGMANTVANDNERRAGKNTLLRMNALN